jgi:hypothetical protein
MYNQENSDPDTDLLNSLNSAAAAQNTVGQTSTDPGEIDSGAGQATQLINNITANQVSPPPDKN